MIRILGCNASQIEQTSPANFAAAWTATSGRFWLDVVAPAIDELAWLQEALQLEPTHVSAVAEGPPAGGLLRYPRYLFGATTLVGLQNRRVTPLVVSFFLGSRFLVTIHSAESALLQTHWEAYSTQPDLWRFGPDHLLGVLIAGMTTSYVNTGQFIEQGLQPLDRLRTWNASRRQLRATTRAALQYGELHALAAGQAAMLDALAACDHEALDANVRARMVHAAQQVATAAAAARRGQQAAVLLRDHVHSAITAQGQAVLQLLLAAVVILLLLQLLGGG